jgi:3-hydroxybenzoate 6-monooxygenase
MFERLGLTEPISALAVFPNNLVMLDSITGEEVTRIALGDAFRNKFQYPYALIHRADFHRVLLEQCRKSNLIKLDAAQKIVDVNEANGGIAAKTANGKDYRGAALIGADGLWSTIREMVVGDGKPKPAGHITYRAVLPTSWDSYGDPAELHERFARTCAPVRMLLNKIESWRMWVLCDRPPIKDWSKGRITLLGDAAHPMLQYLAQGACMAVEDAVCLADKTVEMDGDYAAAFRAYQAVRYLRTGRVQIMARVYGEFYHAAGVAKELRNLMLGSRTPDDAMAGMEWLYGEQKELMRGMAGVR